MRACMHLSAHLFPWFLHIREDSVPSLTCCAGGPFTRACSCLTSHPISPHAPRPSHSVRMHDHSQDTRTAHITSHTQKYPENTTKSSPSCRTHISPRRSRNRGNVTGEIPHMTAPEGGCFSPEDTRYFLCGRGGCPLGLVWNSEGGMGARDSEICFRRSVVLGGCEGGCEGMEVLWNAFIES